MIFEAAFGCDLARGIHLWPPDRKPGQDCNQSPYCPEMTRCAFTHLPILRRPGAGHLQAHDARRCCDLGQMGHVTKP